MTVQFTQTSAAAASITSASLGGGAPMRQRISGAAKDFESILLNQWLQGAEATFGAAPGGDGSEDPDDDQIKSFATQQLATRIAAGGGLGIGRLVQGALQRAEHDTTTPSRHPNLNVRSVREVDVLPASREGRESMGHG